MDHQLNSLPKIQVIIRKRPLNSKELKKNDKDIIDIYDHKELYVQEQKIKVDLTKYVEEHCFIYDNAYDEKISNQDIYNFNVKPLVYGAFQGAKITFFAYGQTSSGKTFTMMGDQ